LESFIASSTELTKHLLTVRVQALLNDSCDVRSPMHLAESAASSGSSWLQSSMNFGSRN